MPVGVMHEVRQEDKCPQGYISITEFAELANVRRDRVARDLANGHFPLPLVCSIPWKGRHGRIICIDSAYLAEYKKSRLIKEKPKQTKTKLAKSKKHRSTSFKRPETSEPVPLEPDDLPPHERQKNTSELVDAAVSLDTENEHSKAYWAIQHTRIKAMREALELQKAKNEVLSVKQVSEMLRGVLLVIKQNLLAIPGRAAPALSGESSVIKIRDYLNTEIKRALKELSKVDKYQSKVSK